MSDGPDFKIERKSSQPRSDVEIRKQTRELRRRQRRKARNSMDRQPWYAIVLAVLLLIAGWFVVGTFLGLEARRAVNMSELAEINATQTQTFDVSPTVEVTPTIDLGATETSEAIVVFATATADARATIAPTATSTPTQTPEPTLIGGSSSSEIAYVAEAGGSPDIYLFNIDTGERTQLTDTPASENDPRFSPDGTMLAFTSNGNGSGRHLYTLDLTDEEAVPVQMTFGIRVITDPVWAADGKSIAFRAVDGNRFFINEVTLDGEESIIIQLPSLEQLYDWSPDKQTVTFYGRTVNSIFEVLVFPVEEGISQARYPITESLGDVQFVNYNKDRDLILFIATAFNPARRNQIYLTDATCQIINDEECIIRRVTEDSFNYLTPRFSPDGDLILTSANTDGNFDVFILDLEGNIVERITESIGDDTEAVWRP